VASLDFWRSESPKGRRDLQLRGRECGESRAVASNRHLLSAFNPLCYVSAKRLPKLRTVAVLIVIQACLTASSMYQKQNLNADGGRSDGVVEDWSNGGPLHTVHSPRRPILTRFQRLIAF
jgi:hypothetical protein